MSESGLYWFMLIESQFAASHTCLLMGPTLGRVESHLLEGVVQCEDLCTEWAGNFRTNGQENTPTSKAKVNFFMLLIPSAKETTNHNICFNTHISFILQPVASRKISVPGNGNVRSGTPQTVKRLRSRTYTGFRNIWLSLLQYLYFSRLGSQSFNRQSAKVSSCPTYQGWTSQLLKTLLAWLGMGNCWF